MALKIDKANVGIKTDLIETGTILHILDENDEPKYLGGDPNKPIQVRVRSVRSEAMKALALRMQKKNAALNRGRRGADVQIPNEEFIARQAAAATLELINFSKDEPVQTATEEELYQHFHTVEMEDVANQIFQYAQDDRNFGGKTSGNAKAEAAETPASPTSEG